EREYYPATHAARDGEKPAVIMGASGATLTYAQLDARSNQLAQVLHAAGLRAGDHVAIFLENDLAYLEVVWAAQRSGLYYTPISSLLTRRELDHVVDDCGAVALVTAPALAHAAAALGERLPRVRVRLAVGGDVDGFTRYEEARDGAPAIPVEPEVAGS